MSPPDSEIEVKGIKSMFRIDLSNNIRRKSNSVCIEEKWHLWMLALRLLLLMIVNWRSKCVLINLRQSSSSLLRDSNRPWKTSQGSPKETILDVVDFLLWHTMSRGILCEEILVGWVRLSISGIYNQIIATHCYTSAIYGIKGQAEPVALAWSQS